MASKPWWVAACRLVWLSIHRLWSGCSSAVVSRVHVLLAPVTSTAAHATAHPHQPQVIEPGFVSTDMVARNPHLLPDKMIRPEDVAEAALLPLHLGPSAAPVEVTLKCVLSPYKTKA